MSLPERPVITLPWRDRPNPVSPRATQIKTSMLEEEADALKQLSTGVDAVLEIGTAYGYASLLMTGGGANVVTIDPHQGYGAVAHSLPVMLRNLAESGVYGKRVFPIIARSDDALPALHAAGARFDLIFVDGGHEADQVEFDVQWAEMLLRPFGTLACHDYDEATCPGVRQALDHQFDDYGPDALVGTLWIRRFNTDRTLRGVA